MRVLTLLLGGLLIAGVASADVRLATKRDGKKVIYNVGGPPRGARGSDLNWLAGRHDRASKFDPIIERYAAQYDVDPTFIRAVIQVESNFNPNCVSNKGARGLMQLMPATARRFGVTNIHDPEQNIHGGVRFLSYLMRLFNGDLPRVLAGYNAGENAVLKYGGIPPYAETSTYVVRAMTVYHGRPYGSAVTFAAGRGKPALRGGFGRSVTSPVSAATPIAAAVIPGARILGTR
ncbi:MAG TPA: lytic transglycosylase domain-containing protein [Thermoanaerobaculia bacterium]